MKFGILTQPLCNNYGGLLQAWALQRTLHSLGHDAVIINRKAIRQQDLGFLHRIACKAKVELYIRTGRMKRRPQISTSQYNYIHKNLIPFIHHRYLGISPDLFTEKQLLTFVNHEKFDGFIVGSDQVWRPEYSPELKDYFLAFAKDMPNIKRIAYAASFGIDSWSFNKKQTAMAFALAPKFDLITVRESSGIDLVAHHLKCHSQLVLDPTMLLDESNYRNLIEKPTIPLYESDGELFCYVLDQSPILEHTINSCAKSLNYRPFRCNATRKVETYDDLKHLDECIFPAVEQWIKSFLDSQMVVTDSFHGTVFSLIFNKPFWVVVNKNRGTTRFSSLLKLFGLEHRIITNSSNINWNQHIDWNKVNSIRLEQANRCRALLCHALS